MLNGATVTGWGAALPHTEVTNDEIALRLGVEPAWITARTGIEARRIAGPEDTATSLGAAAGRKALAAAGAEPGDVDLVIVATLTPDFRLPATSALVQAELGAVNAGAFDLNAGCSGFLFALAQAAALARSGIARKVLVCGVDVLSRVTDPNDLGTAPLFGDGAGAALVEASDRDDLGPFVLRADGRDPHLLHVPPDEDVIRMQGRAVYRRAIDEMAASLGDVLGEARISIDEVALVIGHQANARILLGVAERAGLDPDKLLVSIARVGNTSAASIPLAASEASDNGSLKDGDLVALTAFGAGFCWGSALLRWRVPVARSGSDRRTEVVHV